MALMCCWWYYCIYSLEIIQQYRIAVLHTKVITFMNPEVVIRSKLFYRSDCTVFIGQNKGIKFTMLRNNWLQQFLKIGKVNKIVRLIIWSGSVRKYGFVIWTSEFFILIHNQVWRVSVMLMVAMPFEWVSRYLNSECGLMHKLMHIKSKWNVGRGKCETLALCCWCMWTTWKGATLGMWI